GARQAAPEAGTGQRGPVSAGGCGARRCGAVGPGAAPSPAKGREKAPAPFLGFGTGAGPADGSDDGTTRGAAGTDATATSAPADAERVWGPAGFRSLNPGGRPATGAARPDAAGGVGWGGEERTGAAGCAATGW